MDIEPERLSPEDLRLLLKESFSALRARAMRIFRLIAELKRRGAELASDSEAEFRRARLLFPDLAREYGFEIEADDHKNALWPWIVALLIGLQLGSASGN